MPSVPGAERKEPADVWAAPWTSLEESSCFPLALDFQYRFTLLLLASKDGSHLHSKSSSNTKTKFKFSSLLSKICKAAERVAANQTTWAQYKRSALLHPSLMIQVSYPPSSLNSHRQRGEKAWLKCRFQGAEGPVLNCLGFIGKPQALNICFPWGWSNLLGVALRKPFSLNCSACSLQGENWLSWTFEKLVVAMVCYFILSIINSMAQSYAKRIQQRLNSEEKTK